MYINEDDFDWDITSKLGTQTTGLDDDGDCLNSNKTSSQKDTNGNGIPCDIIVEYFKSSDGNVYTFVSADSGVDEDPDEDAYSREAIHLAFVLSIGKLGFVLLLGIFLPLFMATGLIRDEMTSGTMHFMLAKPIARSEVFLYRTLGYLVLFGRMSLSLESSAQLFPALQAQGMRSSDLQTSAFGWQSSLPR